MCANEEKTERRLASRKQNGMPLRWTKRQREEGGKGEEGGEKDREERGGGGSGGGKGKMDSEREIRLCPL